ncbi:MAG: hypothetical protein ABSB96_02100 [Gaiellaceae bacterium]
MSRLYDRIVQQGCAPLTAREILEWTPGVVEEMGDATRAQLRESLGREPSIAEVAGNLRGYLAQRGRRPSDATLSQVEFDRAVVVSAEDTADYWHRLPSGTNMLDIVSCLTPSFDRLFVEFQHRPNKLGLDSWGVLFVANSREDGWDVEAQLIGERRKGHPVGPLVCWMMALDSQGLLPPGDDEGYGSLLTFPLAIPGVPESVAYEWTNSLAEFLCPAAFAISLLHCRNVSLRTVDPPEKLSRKAERQHGRPLVSYHVLDIEPMRRVLDSDGEAQTKGLRHALHICRGHFKTFTEDAPLFGRHVGTYWWPAYVRGSAEVGTVEKDYRVRLDSGEFGQAYTEADENVTVAPAEEKPDDPDTSQRGLRAHNRTQNLLAAAVEAAGFAPRRKGRSEPNFDLAWKEGETVWVAEVKSTTEKNEEQQMRLAIGQVIRYRQLLSEEGHEARALIAIENAPFDESWIDLCGHEGIALVWPEVMAHALGGQPQTAE